jgi:uncharacterized protein (UPF0335 family)
MGIKRRDNAVGEVAKEVQAEIEDVIESTVETDVIEEDDAPAEKEVVVRQSSAVAAPVVHRERIDVTQEMAANGFEGAAIDFSSYNTITLKEKVFSVSDGSELNAGFKVTQQGSRNKYLFLSKHAEEDDRETFYSYEKDADKNDHELVEKIRLWKEEDGVGYDVKVYVEIVAIMEDDNTDGTLNGEMVLLQISPASIGKWSGFIGRQRMKGCGLPTDYVSVINPGKKIGEGKKAFYPWDFSAEK